MKRIIEIDQKSVVRTAAGLVQNSGRMLCMTMNMPEEIKKPLPAAYHRLINLQARRGVKVIRIGFGSEEDFHFLVRKYSLEKNFVFKYISDTKKYKRMLIADDTIVLFSKTIQNHRRFFLSEDKKVVSRYKKYFKQTFSQSHF